MNSNGAKHNAFTLIEVLVALIAATLALIAVFAIYERVSRAADSIQKKLDGYILPSEILQRIAEDLDKVAAPGTDAKITIANSFQSGFPTAQLVISSQILDKDGKFQTLEKITWQTDFDRATGRMILYRCHSGLIWEDNLLDKEQRADWSPDRQLFVPLCTGLSYFKIQVPQPQNLTQQSAEAQNGQPAEQKFLDAWSDSHLPPAVTVTISFADPLDRRVAGAIDVPDEQKIIRTIVIDRSKKTNFVYVPLGDTNQPGEPNTPAVQKSSAGGSSRGQRQTP
jgi:type II secretory pathway pseudopilin PulG